MLSVTCFFITDVKNETSLSSSSFRHFMLQYFGIFQPSSGIMMTFLTFLCYLNVLVVRYSNCPVPMSNQLLTSAPVLMMVDTDTRGASERESTEHTDRIDKVHARESVRATHLNSLETLQSLSSF